MQLVWMLTDKSYYVDSENTYNNDRETGFNVYHYSNVGLKMLSSK